MMASKKKGRPWANSTTPVDSQPKGYLRILTQEEFEELDYPVYEGESSIGRGEDCDLTIEAVSLSRKHAMILVEKDAHFVMDNDSRNKTFRKSVELRPNAFYELTNGCELIFADIKCQYFIGSPLHQDTPDVRETKETHCDQTQAYGIAEYKAGTDEEAEENPLPSIEKVSVMHLEDDDGEEVEATQLYAPEMGGVEEGEMECEPTVLGANNSDDDGGSCPSSPSLLPTRLLPRTNSSDDGESTVEGSRLASSWKEADQRDEASKEEGRGGSAGPMEEADPTMAYDMKTDDEDEEAEGVEGGGVLESTLILSRQPSDSDQTDFEDVGEREDISPRRGEEGVKKEADIDSTVARPILEGDRGGVSEDSDQTDFEGEEGRASREEKRNYKGNDVLDPLASSTSTDDDKSINAQRRKHSFSLVPVVTTQGRRRGRGRARKEVGRRARGRGRGKTNPQPEGARAGDEELGDNGGPRGKDVAQASFVPSNTREDEEEDTVKVGSRRLVTRKTRKKILEEPPSMDTEKLPIGNSDSPEQASLTTDTLEEPIPEARPQRSSRRVRGRKSDPPPVELSSCPPSSVTNINTRQGKEEVTAEAGKPTRRTRANILDELPSVNITKLLLGHQSSPEQTPATEASPKKSSTRQRRGVKKSEALSELSSGPSSAVSNFNTLEEEEEDADKIGSRRLVARRTRAKILDKPRSVDTKKLPLSNLNSSEQASLTTATSEEPVPETKPPKMSRQVRGKKSDNSPAELSSSSAHTQHAMLAPKDGKESKPSENTSKFSEESPDTDAALVGGGGAGSQGDTTAAGHDSTIPTASGSLDRQGRKGGVPFDGAVSGSDGDKKGSERASKDARQMGKGRGRGVRGGGKAVAGKSPAGRGRLKASPRSNLTLHHYATPKSDVMSPLPSPSSAASEARPCVMFTGMIDLEGERIVKALGGELVDSVYQCTHLVTDKIRRTVKFLCCLSRGCWIVSDSWLAACGKAGHFLPAGGYLVKDKATEKQHGFSLSRAHDYAKRRKLLSGYEVYLTPNLKPDRAQMSDIIFCSGGEPSNFLSPLPERPNTVVISCTEDLDMCRERLEAGQPVHSAEFILGGVLRQELDLKSVTNDSAADGNGRKRREREGAPTSSSKRRRK